MTDLRGVVALGDWSGPHPSREFRYPRWQRGGAAAGDFLYHGRGMRLSFSKMHGLGNDFVLLERSQLPQELNVGQIRGLADRRRGVGFDQLLVIGPAGAADADFRLEIFNADGERAEQCGNGVRCVARYIERKGLSEKRELTIESSGRLIRLVRESGSDIVNGDMGTPVFEPQEIPFIADRRAARYEIEAAGQRLEVGALSLGNPHAVLVVDDVEHADLPAVGPALERHPRFPNRVNVGFMEIVNSGRVRLRVHERGVGETLACGTGACAAVVAGRLWGRLSERVSVDLPGGTLRVSWPGEGASVWLAGPATWVYEGILEL